MIQVFSHFFKYFPLVSHHSYFICLLGVCFGVFQGVFPHKAWSSIEEVPYNRAPLLCYFKLCASFRSYQWNQTGVTVWKRPIWVKIDAFFVPCNLEVWWMILKNNRVTRDKKIANFDLNWAFPDCNSSLNSSMALKWCTLKLDVVMKRCPIVF